MANLSNYETGLRESRCYRCKLDRKNSINTLWLVISRFKGKLKILYATYAGLHLSRSKVQRNEVPLEFSYTLTLEMMVMSPLQMGMHLIHTDPLATQHPYNVEVSSIFPYTLETQLHPGILLTKTQIGRKVQTSRRYLACLSHGAMHSDSSRPLVMCIWTRGIRQAPACSVGKSVRAKLG